MTPQRGEQKAHEQEGKPGEPGDQCQYREEPATHHQHAWIDEELTHKVLTQRRPIAGSGGNARHDDPCRRRDQ